MCVCRLLYVLIFVLDIFADNVEKPPIIRCRGGCGSRQRVSTFTRRETQGAIRPWKRVRVVRTRVLDLECSLTRLGEDMTTSHKRMEKMMQCLLHKVGSKQSIAGDDIQAQASSAKYIRCFGLSVFRSIDVPNLSRRTTSIGVRKLGRYHILEAWRMWGKNAGDAAYCLLWR